MEITYYILLLDVYNVYNNIALCLLLNGCCYGPLSFGPGERVCCENHFINRDSPKKILKKGKYDFNK